MAITRAERLAASNQRLTTFIISKTQLKVYLRLVYATSFFFTFHIANLPIPWKPQKLKKSIGAFGLSVHTRNLSEKRKRKKAHQLSTALLQVESFIRHFKVLHGIGSLKMALLYKVANATTTQKLIPIFCLVIRVISIHYAVTLLTCSGFKCSSLKVTSSWQWLIIIITDFLLILQLMVCTHKV